MSEICFKETSKKFSIRVSYAVYESNIDMKDLHIVSNPLLNIVLDRPRIAGNIAAIVRTAVATQCALHVCGPLIFDINDKTKWRAGLDYFFGARIHFHNNLERCLDLLKKTPWLVETRGQKAPWQIDFALGDVIIFGPETGCIKDEVQNIFKERILTLPQFGPVRSLNLAQCASAVIFEAMRQYMVS